MDWGLLASSFALALAGVVIIILIVALHEITGGISTVLLVVLGIVIVLTLAVYDARGGFKPKPAEAPIETTK